MFDWCRAVPVAVGHADGIHSRTIEILQVRCAFCPHVPSLMFPFSELWAG